MTHFTTWNLRTGQLETRYTHIDNGIEWRNSFRVSTAVNLTTEGVLEPFEIFPGVVVPVGTYDHAEGQTRIATNQGAPVSFGALCHRRWILWRRPHALGPEVSLRVGEAFNSQLTWSTNYIRLPGGSFRTNLGSLRGNYSLRRGCSSKAGANTTIERTSGRPTSVRDSLRRQQRSVRRLQRYAGARVRSTDRCRTNAHAEIQPIVRPAQLKLLNGGPLVSWSGGRLARARNLDTLGF